jgi:hypothetical protein
VECRALPAKRSESDEAENGAVTVGLFEEVAAEARFLIPFIGEIEVAAFVENLPRFGAGNFA